MPTLSLEMLRKLPQAQQAQEELRQLQQPSSQIISMPVETAYQPQTTTVETAYQPAAGPLGIPLWGWVVGAAVGGLGLYWLLRKK